MDFGRDGKGFEPFFIGGRERKESSASNLSGSSIKDNIRRMTAFWDATPEQIAITLTKLEWEYFIALEAWPVKITLIVASRHSSTYVDSGG